MKITEAIQEFMDWNQLRGLSETTLANHRRRLLFFARSWPADVETITYRQLLTYFKDRDVSEKTLRNEISLAKTFFAYLVEAGHIAQDPATLLPLPAWERPEVEVLTADEVEELIELARTPRIGGARSAWYATRNAALVIMLVDTGLRRRELCKMRRADVHLEERYALVRFGKGRGGKCQGRVVLSERTVAAVRAHWQTQKGGEWCFETYNGKPLSPKALSEIIYRLSARFGRHVHPHMLRHTCATCMLENNVNLRLVQEQLRHKNVNTTMIYTHTNLDMRIKNHAVFKPNT